MPEPTTLTEPVAFATGLARYGERVALLSDSPTGSRSVTYTELAKLVAAQSAQLGDGRRLILVRLERTIEAVTTYLAVLASGHVALLASEDDDERARDLEQRYNPDVRCAREADGWKVTERRFGSAHTLHPDLACLLSTSGSTGSPKVVRLSSRNVQANAESITAALGITANDRAISTLPLTYCYGLSVLHSHLAMGASVLLSAESVVTNSLWESIDRHEVTTLPGVPHTFDLLNRVGFADKALPHLRSVTVAGGRLSPELICTYASLGQQKGYRLHVMYGQTEGTARIATLDPDLALQHPDSIGVAVPGGHIELEMGYGDDPEVGEIVYRGPNVMLGYAECPADLARGREIEELHTGDLARQDADGIYRIVGRRSRHAKVFGLRVDLDHAEQVLAERGVTACLVSDDTGLCVLAQGDMAAPEVADQTALATGLPIHVLRTRVVDELPRLPSGKVDRAAAASLFTGTDLSLVSPTSEQPTTAETVTALYGALLGRPDATPEDSFVALGGDSLSYVEISVRLEELLGDVPDQWHTRSPRQLVAEPTSPLGKRQWLAFLDTGVALRALAIVAIVGTHVGLFQILGGAHVLLGLAGFSMARFLLDVDAPSRRSPRVLRGAARIAVPSVIWIAMAALVTSQYGWSNIVLLGTVLGPDAWGPAWHYWFVEALVLYLLIAAALLAVPAFDRAERAYPFAVTGTLVAIGLAVGHGVLPWLADPRPSSAPAMYYFWFFALGWWAARATMNWQRLLVSAVVLLAVPGYWGDVGREAAIALGFLVLIWVPKVRTPRFTVPLLTKLAAASLAIYLTHWLVFPRLEGSPVLALAVSLAVGVLCYDFARAAVKAAKSWSFWSAYASAYCARARSALSLAPR